MENDSDSGKHAWLPGSDQKSGPVRASNNTQTYVIMDARTGPDFWSNIGATH